MRAVSDRWNPTLSRSGHGVISRVFSEYAGVTGRQLPIIAGQITFDATALGRRRVTLTVPLYGPDGFRWDPGDDPLHPLATYGQRLVISLGVVHVGGDQELVPQGSFLITGVRADETDGIVSVEGSDLIQLMLEQKIFLMEDSELPLPTDTHLTAIDKLMWPALHSNIVGDVKILPTSFEALPVFPISGTTVIRDGADRVELIKTIAEAWPASFYVDDAARLHFAVPVTGPKDNPDATVTAALPDSTILTTGRDQNRRRAYNAVRVSGRDSATGETIGTADSYLTTGPLSVRGPYGMVPRWYVSPYAVNQPHAQQIAIQLLNEGTLYTRTERVTCVPNPAVELNDTIAVITPEGGFFKGLVAAITIPLTAAGGPMTMDVTNHVDQGP